jgi:putative addiction module component (TIGR02574 family)
MSEPAFNFDSLSVSERIQLVEDLWDSIAATVADVPLTAAQSDEIDRRLESLERDPRAGAPWSEVRARIEERLRDCG